MVPAAVLLPLPDRMRPPADPVLRRRGGVYSSPTARGLRTPSPWPEYRGFLPEAGEEEPAGGQGRRPFGGEDVGRTAAWPETPTSPGSGASPHRHRAAPQRSLPVGCMVTAPGPKAAPFVAREVAARDAVVPRADPPVPKLPVGYGRTPRSSAATWNAPPARDLAEAQPESDGTEDEQQPPMPRGQRVPVRRHGPTPSNASPSTGEVVATASDGRNGNASTWQLHTTGRCRPCAWYWKPKGCLNAQDCDYCHWCPDGELKKRKKMKVTAMRMGALTPVRSFSGPRTARRLRLAPFLVGGA